MNIDSANRWFALVSNLAVLVGIIFLAVEIAQSNRIATGATEADIRERWTNISNSIIDNPEFADTWVKLQEADPELTEAERSQVFNYARNHWMFFASVQTAYDNNLIAEDTFAIYSSILPNVLRNNPGFAPFFETFINARSGSNVGESEMARIAQDVFQELRN